MILFCGIYLFEPSTFALKMIQIHPETIELPLGCRCCGGGRKQWLPVCLPVQGPQGLARGMRWALVLPEVQGRQESPAEEGQGKGKCVRDLACVICQIYDR